MTSKAIILKAIRQNCLECSGGSPLAVKECNIPRCTMYPYRMGTDPDPNPLKQEQGKKLSELSKKDI